MKARMVRSPSAWCRVTREPSGAFVLAFGARGEKDAYRAFRYPPAELPTIPDALVLAAALVEAPPLLAAVSVPTTWVADAHRHDHTAALERVRGYPVARGAYQVPVHDREALRALLHTAGHYRGEVFDEAEAHNLALRLARALGAV